MTSNFCQAVYEGRQDAPEWVKDTTPLSVDKWGTFLQEAVMIISVWTDKKDGMKWLDEGNNGPCTENDPHPSELPDAEKFKINVKITDMKITDYLHEDQQAEVNVVV